MPVLANPSALHIVTQSLAARFTAGHDWTINKVVGLEARGFLFGMSVARLLRAGFIPLRKPGKLPGPVVAHNYDLEYGQDKLEMQEDALQEGDKVLLVDDLLATGGTALAAIELIKLQKAEIIGCSFVVELSELGGRSRIEATGHTVHSTYSFTEDE